MQHIVTKFGGTSVSTRNTWNNILSIIQKHLSSGVQPVIVCSALTQISNKLEKAIEAALINEHQSIFNEIRIGHFNLAEQLEVDPQLIAEDLQQLERWLTGIALLKQAPAKTHAQVLSMGELMMTRLGHAFL
jgi:bifunctional diaminopimelate decarboxylase / aspartate kinase